MLSCIKSECCYLASSQCGVILHKVTVMLFRIKSRWCYLVSSQGDVILYQVKVMLSCIKLRLWCIASLVCSRVEVPEGRYDHLMFNGQFESGNLRKATQVSRGSLHFQIGLFYSNVWTNVWRWRSSWSVINVDENWLLTDLDQLMHILSVHIASVQFLCKRL